MSTATTETLTADHPAHRSLWNSSNLALGALILLVVTATPQLICMPVTNDVSYYDLQARTVLRGGVLYRDMVEPNFPGVVWVHLTVRSLFGWSTAALRAVDLCLFSLTVLLLTRFVSAVRFQLGFVLFLAYYSVSEWCHVQRDLWLLLPIALALNLRWAQIQRSALETISNRTIFLYGLLEGLVWGAGVWLKPHIVIPALAVWLCSLSQPALRHRALKDLAGLITGGLLMGALGIGWLYWYGALPSFLEMQLDWNQEYLTDKMLDHYGFVIFNMVVRLFPYSFIHLAAIPTALALLVRQNLQRDPSDRLRLHLLSALYLAWCLQVVLLQHPFDYVHFPPLLLGITLLTYWIHCNRSFPRLLKITAGGFIALALICSPVTKPDYLCLWDDCLQQGSTSTIRNQLARIPYPDWEDLERVADYLRQQQTQDREITCYSNDLVHLYLYLDLEPSTRYVYSHHQATFFPSKRSLILKALRNSPQKYILTNLMTPGLLVNQAKEIGPEGPHGYPPAFPDNLKSDYPWNLPIAFRSGTLAVHHYPGKSTNSQTVIPTSKSIQPRSDDLSHGSQQNPANE
ncbi:hypothetical protein Pan161_29060 [Gimesia algae]|uniref:Glycosyltransferase RgtA/B/C/D-like domain-containing protein n=2 Tax=Gimesia algae TaxID=2527971 RepID=A0A517VE27_9PLAN|nr:hypothetical protein Pan161_29060 [Gimesia algae]